METVVDLIASDAAARRIALTALDRTLLVEAGAGSGKTSVLAGRVACLLAAGTDPTQIAAISFTELAAGELRERIERFVDELAAGHVRADLKAAFPDGVDVAQRRHLAVAQMRLDALVCTTIHGFCQRLLTPYPVEAGMDPGAVIADREAADALFGEVFDEWLRERLDGALRSDDLLVRLCLQDPAGSVAMLSDLAEQLRRRPDARIAPPADEDGRTALREAATTFHSWCKGLSVCEPETLDIARALVASCDEGWPADTAGSLLHRLHLAAPEACAKGGGDFAAYRRKGKWEAALAASRSKQEAKRLNEEAAMHYNACRSAHEAVRTNAAGELLHRLAGDLCEVLTRFAAHKRDAALIDFDDLLGRTRDLLAARPEVQRALAERHAAVLVDEFQDTDPMQCEILWRLCGEPDAADPAWTRFALRPGALFLVGDPKQAIYRFRGGDVACYRAARERLLAADPASCLAIGRNFRSVAPILDWVNARFEAPLSATGQPGFQALFSDVAAMRPAVATLSVAVAQKPTADELRDAEAEAVAEFCARIVGALPVRDGAGERPCRAGDIALLAPGGTDLWRYERSLEARNLAVSTQAGKGFYRRQEVQDLIALARVLADPRDTLALGALLRGPLVGLTEEALLDAHDALPSREDGEPARIWLWTPITDVAPGLLRETLEILQSLAKGARSTTPYVLLCRAVEELQLRPLLRRRHDRTAERALTNLDLFLEAARPYDVRGLRAFAAAMRARWEDAERALEGRPDAERESVSIVTMHSAKGLEWPVVVPINMGTKVMNAVNAAVDASGTLHLPVLGRLGPGGEAALEAEREELSRERHRLLYVAMTRARDLLVLPAPSSGASSSSWLGALSLGIETLAPYVVDGLGEARLHRESDPPNLQDLARFETEASLIASRATQMKRITPHLAEAADPVPDEALLPDTDGDVATGLPPRGSRARGLALHKLIEEVLTGETDGTTTALAARAAALAHEIPDAPGADTIDAAEAAATAMRGLALPEIAVLRSRLVPECWIAASVTGAGMELITIGVADAVAIGADGTPEVVIDWKSDVAPDARTVADYRAQLAAYLHAAGAREGLLVFLTSGRIEHVRF